MPRGGWRGIGGSFMGRRNSMARIVNQARVNLSYAPRVSRVNPVAVRHFNNAVRFDMNRSIGPGVKVPGIGGLGNSLIRSAQMAGERNSVRAFQNAVMANAGNRQTIVKYRDPKTGAVTDYPISRMNLNKFGSQGWRYQQNSAGQRGNRGYSSGMSQFAINAPSGVGLNKMR